MRQLSKRQRAACISVHERQCPIYEVAWEIRAQEHHELVVVVDRYHIFPIHLLVSLPHQEEKLTSPTGYYAAALHMYLVEVHDEGQAVSSGLRRDRQRGFAAMAEEVVLLTSTKFNPCDVCCSSGDENRSMLHWSPSSVVFWRCWPHLSRPHHLANSTTSMPFFG